MKKFNWLMKAGLMLSAFGGVANFALAQTNVVGDNCLQFYGTISYIICKLAFFVNTLIPIMISVGVLMFIIGIVMYVIAKDEEAKSRGRNLMIWGLLGLLVIVSIWGLIKIVKVTFGVEDKSAIQVPCIESPGIPCPQTQ